MKTEIKLHGTTVSACYILPAVIKTIKDESNTTETMTKITIEQRTKNLKPVQIVDIVSAQMELSSLSVLSRSRKSHLCDARFICMYFMRNFKRMSYQAIGNVFNRDHATVLHGLRKCEALIETDEIFRHHLESVRNTILR